MGYDPPELIETQKHREKEIHEWIRRKDGGHTKAKLVNIIPTEV